MISDSLGRCEEEMKQCRWKKYFVIGRHNIYNIILFKNMYLIVCLLFSKSMCYSKCTEDDDV